MASVLPKSQPFLENEFPNAVVWRKNGTLPGLMFAELEEALCPSHSLCFLAPFCSDGLRAATKRDDSHMGTSSEVQLPTGDAVEAAGQAPGTDHGRWQASHCTSQQQQTGMTGRSMPWCEHHVEHCMHSSTTINCMSFGTKCSHEINYLAPPMRWRITVY